MTKAFFRVAATPLRALFAVLASTCCLSAIVSANFLPRDFIETSFRVQTTSSKNSSAWLQLEGSKAPIFGAHKHALISIPRSCDSLQLAFDHQRFVTPWLKLSGSAVHRVRNPVIHVELTRTGAALSGAHGAVYSYKKNTGMAGEVEIRESKQFMGKLFREFYDESGVTAAKQVLVKYTWKTRHDRDVHMAVLVLMLLGVVVAGMMGLSTFVAYKQELRNFYSDLGTGMVGAPGEASGRSESGRSEGGMHTNMGTATATAASGLAFPAGRSTATSGHVRQQQTVRMWQQQGRKAD